MTWVSIWPALAALSAVADWIGVSTSRPRVEYVAKPLTILLLTAWLLIGVGMESALALPTLLVLVALLFSLAGDILLMLPAARFLPGLVLFLMAHLSYVLAFAWEMPRPATAEWLLGAAIAFLLACLLPPVRAGLRRSGRPELVGPVAAYALILGAMLWASVGTLLRPSWLAAGASWIALGGLAFFASDASLVWDRFVAPLPGRRVTTHALYHLAQLALTGGVVSVASS
jgi:uncharacterized membrane protein YhhN